MMFTIILIITTRKRKILIVFDDMLADIMSNKKFESIIKNYLSDARN